MPGALGAVVDRTLAKDPAERFQTAEELSRALVEALPAAARDSVHVQSAWTSLWGLGRAGCVVLGGLGAGACVLALSIFSKPPRIQASSPVPDSLTQALRRQGALARGDVPLYVFGPRGVDDTTLLVVARRSVAVVTPHRIRAYPRDSVRARFGLQLWPGLSFRMMLMLPRSRRDTVFRRLSFRDVYETAPRLGKLLGEDAARAGR